MFKPTTQFPRQKLGNIDSVAFGAFGGASLLVIVKLRILQKNVMQDAHVPHDF